MRGEARGLLREVSEASAAVDEARLLGERLIWYAGRYPFLIGEQAELTAYRLIDQPESMRFLDAINSAKQLSDALTERIQTIQKDLDEQQTAFFTEFSSEREAAIDYFFDRFARERGELLTELSAREAELVSVMTELRETIETSGTLANNLTDTVDAIDKVLSHFDQGPDSQGEPLRILDIRDTAIEAGLAAERLTVMLERVNNILESKSWDQTIDSLTQPADDLVDRIFWRGLILICILISGVGLLRLVPQKISDVRAGQQPDIK